MSDRTIELRALGALDILEEAPDPRLQVLLEQLLFRLCANAESAVRNAGHDLAQDRGVIFGFRMPLGASNTKRFEISAQARKRPLVQEAGQIIRTVRQQLAAPEPDKKIEELSPGVGRVSLRCGSRERRMRNPERRRIYLQTRQPAEDVGAGCSRQQGGQQRVLLRPCLIYLVAVGRRQASVQAVRGIKIRAQDLTRDTRLDSTVRTRSAGTRDQLETDGCAMPIRRASSVMLPTADMAWASPSSRISPVVQNELIGIISIRKFAQRQGFVNRRKRFSIARAYD